MGHSTVKWLDNPIKIDAKIEKDAKKPSPAKHKGHCCYHTTGKQKNRYPRRVKGWKNSELPFQTAQKNALIVFMHNNCKRLEREQFLLSCGPPQLSKVS